MAAFVRNSPPLAGAEGKPVMLPGEPEARSTAAREAAGVPIPTAVWCVHISYPQTELDLLQLLCGIPQK